MPSSPMRPPALMRARSRQHEHVKRFRAGRILAQFLHRFRIHAQAQQRPDEGRDFAFNRRFARRALWRDRFQRRQQFIRIVLDRCDAVAREQFRDRAARCQLDLRVRKIGLQILGAIEQGGVTGATADAGLLPLQLQRRERLQHDPPARLQNSKRLSQRALFIGHMKKSFLTYHHIHTGVRKRDPHNVAFNYANVVL